MIYYYSFLIDVYRLWVEDDTLHVIHRIPALKENRDDNVRSSYTIDEIDMSVPVFPDTNRIHKCKALND